MMDAVVGYLSRTWRKDSVAVMIHAHDGAQFIVDRNHFVTRQGRTIAQKGYWETVTKAALRTIRYLDKRATESDFEVFKPRNLGPNRTHFVVWFPAPEAFQADAVTWKHYLFAVNQEDLFTRAQLRAINFVSTEARKLHDHRQR